jgi:hypothetical protein
MTTEDQKANLNRTMGRLVDCRDQHHSTSFGASGWLFSIVVHGALFAALGLFVPKTPQGAAVETSREGGIVLTVRMPDPAEYFSAARSTAPAVKLIAVEPVNESDSLRTAIIQPSVFHIEIDIGERPLVDSMLTSAVLPIREPVLPLTEIPSGAPRRGHAHGAETQVFGVKGTGSRFVYVFDRSSSMEGPPLSAAKRELVASLHSLQSMHQFQIIFYNQQPHIMSSFRGRAAQLTSADEQGKRQATKFIGGIFADGATDHVQALAMALSLRPDVIFFLSDASEPQLRAEELARIQRMNQGTSINTIEFGSGPPSASYNFLRLLAEQNSGQHTYVDVAGLPIRMWMWPVCRGKDREDNRPPYRRTIRVPKLYAHVSRELGPSGVTLANGLDGLSQKLVDLLRRAADKLQRVHDGRNIDIGKCLIGHQPLEQVIRAAVLLDVQGRGLAVLANPLVQVLAVATSLHGGHENVFRRHERQLGPQIGGDHFGIHHQARGDVLQKEQDGIRRQKRLRDDEPAIGAVVERTLHPLHGGGAAGV